MNPVTVIIDPPSPDLRAIQDRCNKALVHSGASVCLFTRQVGDNPKEWCVLIEFGSKRRTLPFYTPINEGDIDEIVNGAKAWAEAPRAVHSNYQPFDL